MTPGVMPSTMEKYKRIAKEAHFDSQVNYSAGDRVYHQGFLYEAVANIPSAVWMVVR